VCLAFMQPLCQECLTRAGRVEFALEDVNEAL
jgi:hypothetical protein